MCSSDLGTVPTLQEAVRVMAACELGKTLTDTQTKQIVAFLNSLTGKFPQVTLPHLPQTPDSTLLMKVADMAKEIQKK